MFASFSKLTSVVRTSRTAELLKVLKVTLAIALLPCITSCIVDPIELPSPSSSGVYVLNNGSWGGNNSSIGIYNPETKELSANVFSSVNGKLPGDLGQDILVDGEKVYIAMNGSQLVYVTDRELRIQKEVVALTKDGVKLSPRCLAKGRKGVYVSYYEGYLGLISEDGSVSLTPVGPNPEGVACSEGKVYVAASGGYLYPVYNNSVSVVDEESFSEISTVIVNTNPVSMKACGSRIYIFSYGDYSAVAPMLQYIDCIEDGGVGTVDCKDSPSAIALYDGILYVLCGGYDSAGNPLPGSVNSFDARTGKFLKTFSQAVPNAYSISATDGYIWVGSSDYKTNGDVYVFSEDGNLYDIFDSQGLNPQVVVQQAE